jgi:hypothetical protein
MRRTAGSSPAGERTVIYETVTYHCPECREETESAPGQDLKCGWCLLYHVKVIALVEGTPPTKARATKGGRR